ncbi:MAG TPA: Ig-like domain-containing protein [Thermoanaerobaculia bacterium]|nr:Ig-like domain-containing protein [Thermoanaerobaculia bacterium]
MKLKALLPALAAGVVGLALSSSALGQCPSTGCPVQTIGNIDTPVEGRVVSGFVRVTGFALDGALISNVDLFVDGQNEVDRVTVSGGANINLPRPDVEQAFPSFWVILSRNSGFEMSFKASNYSNGTHVIFVRVTDVNGCCFFLGPRTVTIDNSRNQPPFGNLDFPLANQPTGSRGTIEVTGWALDDRRVDHVDILVDGLLERQAVLGIYRPDVAAYYPDTMGSLTSGFLMNLDATRLTNGVHNVTVKAVDDQGQQGLLGSRNIQVFYDAPNLPPFGQVEFPLLNSTWFGNCIAQTGGPSGGDIVDTRFLQHIIGWALDVSIREERGGVAYIQAEIDGVTIKDTRNCHREINLANELIDCYGYYRPDVELFYPGFQQCPNCGFHFFVDVGFLLTQRGIREGGHILQIKAADKEDQIALIKEIPIVLECATGQLDPPSICYVDDPPNYKFINGVYTVIGWSLDLDNVAQVRILIDGIPQIDAVRGVDFAELGLPSPDVAAVYKNFPNNGAARWRFFLDTTKLSNSEHDLIVEVTDGRGNRRGCGTRRFLVDNNTVTR